MQKISLTELQVKLHEALNSERDLNERHDNDIIDQDAEKPMALLTEQQHDSDEEEEEE